MYINTIFFPIFHFSLIVSIKREWNQFATNKTDKMSLPKNTDYKDNQEHIEMANRAYENLVKCFSQ